MNSHPSEKEAVTETGVKEQVIATKRKESTCNFHCVVHKHGYLFPIRGGIVNSNIEMLAVLYRRKLVLFDL